MELFSLLEMENMVFIATLDLRVKYKIPVENTTETSSAKYQLPISEVGF